MINTKEFKYGSYPFEYFNPVQSETFNHIEKDCNVAVAAATSSGKTVCAELIAAKSLKEGKRVAYLTPLKALTEEKCQDWANGHYFSDYPMIVLTGDYKLTEEREALLQKAKIIVSTYEMFSVRCRRFSIERSKYIDEIGTLIVDEAHFIGSLGRGDHLENSLILFTRRNPTARIVFLSATMENYRQMAEWLTDLNKKSTEVVFSTYRPCQLNIHYEPFVMPKYYKRWEYHAISERLILDKLTDIISLNPDDQWLVFAHSKTIQKKAYVRLDERFDKIAAIHNADLDKSQRATVEANFRDKKIQYLVATSTLAYGLNLPARRVAILGTDRGPSDVDPLDIIQECGRAGRPKYDKEGDATIILDKNKLSRWMYILNRPPIVKSTIVSKIGFHLIGEIAEKRITAINEIASWSNRTLATKQDFFSPTQAEFMFKEFIANGLIRLEDNTPLDFNNTDKDESYVCTYLGKLAAYHYFDPLDVVSWKNNFKVIHDKQLLQDTAAVAWAISNVRSMAGGYVPKDLKSFSNSFMSNISPKQLRSISEGALTLGTVLWMRMNNDEEVMKRFYSFIVPYITDIDRIVSCISKIYIRILKGNPGHYFDKLIYRVKYGVSWEEADLCRLNGIGVVYARELALNGIKSVEQFKAKENKVLVSTLLSSQVFKKAMSTIQVEDSW